MLPLPNTDLTISALCYGGVSWGTRASDDDMDKLVGVFRDAGDARP